MSLLEKINFITPLLSKMHVCPQFKTWYATRYGYLKFLEKSLYNIKE